MKRNWLIWAVLAAVALPAGAGIHYKSRTWQEGGEASDALAMQVEAWVEGESAKILFQESGNPVLGAGNYLVTSDGGRTIYLVDPEERTYSKWDLDGMLELAGNVLQGMRGIVKFTIENAKVETLLSEPGETLAGLPTTHVRYRTTYDMEIKVLGIKQRQSVDATQDLWLTDALTDVALGVWLRKEQPKTGNDDLDRLIALEAEKLQGFPLKTIDHSVATGKKGKETVTRTISEVFFLDRSASIAAGTFGLPAGYTETQSLPTGAAATAEDEPEETEEKGGLFGKLKRRVKGDGGF